MQCISLKPVKHTFNEITVCDVSFISQYCADPKWISLKNVFERYCMSASLSRHISRPALQFYWYWPLNCSYGSNITWSPADCGLLVKALAKSLQGQSLLGWWHTDTSISLCWESSAEWDSWSCVFCCDSLRTCSDGAGMFSLLSSPLRFDEAAAVCLVQSDVGDDLVLWLCLSFCGWY